MIKEKLVQFLIKSAMTFEEETHNFYVRCMEEESNDRIRELFRLLAEEEITHKGRLEDLLSSNLEDVLKVEDDEVPSVLGLSGRETKGTAGSTGKAVDILTTALEHEVSSYNFYVLLGKRSSLSVLKKAFNFLATEEERHVRHIKAMMDELASDGRMD